MNIVSRKFPKGLFITLEGLEGSGKTTQTEKLKEWFQSFGHEVVVVHEPGGTPYGLKARELFLAEHRNLVPQAEIGLLLTAKAQLLYSVILPAMKAGKVVICDRYTDTLFAYQGWAKGHSLRMIEVLLEAFDCDVNPDLTIMFDITPETSVRRSLERKNAGGAYTDLDAETVDFHSRVRKGLLSRLSGAPNGRGTAILTCDHLSIPQVRSTMIENVAEFLKQFHDRPVSVMA